ncbi:MAG: alkaline phosphatase D family protein, partial [Planctomycetes bacterium]|nr:alkaline phosphatase D family protein [Planctomycetota bacterium]
QAMRSRDLEITGDSRQKGFRSYLSMAKLRPQFLVSTGDSVYYDNDGFIAWNEAFARHHWNRMYALLSVRALLSVTSGYWEKDDHDYRWNDAWPQDKIPGKPKRVRSMITDEMGRRLFRESVPMGEKTYRTFVWGKGVQIWLGEGGDFRSPRSTPDRLEDGLPVRSLWGHTQRRWLKRTLKESTCRYKILISPTPIIGPDRENKKDNHANKLGFWLEGRDFLKWVAAENIGGFYIICGDRHWQYHSVDPETNVQEFCTGPISDKHSGGTPGFDPEIHKYHQVIGGFFSVNVKPLGDNWRITMTFHKVDGSVAHEVVDP